MIEANHMTLEILRNAESKKADDAMMDEGRAKASEYLVKRRTGFVVRFVHLPLHLSLDNILRSIADEREDCSSSDSA
tara:strand:- start:30 stop:260 length:231 start_codon:yes stop_codon:yes gene_type:complete